MVPQVPQVPQVTLAPLAPLAPLAAQANTYVFRRRLGDELTCLCNSQVLKRLAVFFMDRKKKINLSLYSDTWHIISLQNFPTRIVLLA